MESLKYEEFHPPAPLLRVMCFTEKIDRFSMKSAQSAAE